MKKILGIAATFALASIPMAALAIDPGDQLALNALLENKSNVPIAVIGFCNGTGTPADLEGFVGEKKDGIDLVASLSGTGRKSVTIIVPAHWFYKVRLDPSPAGVSCKVTGWPLK
jgi:hypothetical protein